MKFSSMIPERIREKFLQEILDMYAEGELSASRASQMLGIPRATFYDLLAETNTSLPKKLNESIKREIRELL
jgi:DNA-binding ferritin-like protein (Dps family)